jgi:hypothetical protein
MPDHNDAKDVPDIDTVEHSYGQEKDISPVEDGNQSTASRRMTYSNAERRKLYRRVDMWVVPITTILYLFSFIDRANIVSQHRSPKRDVLKRNREMRKSKDWTLPFI